MSNVNAVAVATEGLRALLQRALDEAGTATVTGAKVGAVRPHAIPADFRGVNVFLYQTTPNAALRNDDLPTRRSSGELMRRPQLALDLHYLLTFTGDEAELEPQRIFGAAAAGLHAHPALAPEDLEELAQNAPSGSYLRLHNDLAQQVERVRFSFAPLNLEELSKLWAMFPQKPYDLSAALRASVVLLEAPLTPVPVRPVLRREVHTSLAPPPTPSAITPRITTPSPISVPAGGTLSFGVEPAISPRRRVRVIVGRHAIPWLAPLPGPGVPAEHATLAVTLPPEIGAGRHPLRVEVDGATSALVEPPDPTLPDAVPSPFVEVTG